MCSFTPRRSAPLTVTVGAAAQFSVGPEIDSISAGLSGVRLLYDGYDRGTTGAGGTGPHQIPSLLLFLFRWPMQLLQQKYRHHRQQQWQWQWQCTAPGECRCRVLKCIAPRDCYSLPKRRASQCTGSSSAPPTLLTVGVPNL